MKLPFTKHEFLQVFADYNEGIWPAQILAAVFGAVAVVLLFSNKHWADRAIAAILAVFWITTGAGFHWLYFSDINPAAYLFAALFLAAALIFVVEGAVNDRVRFEFSWDLRGWAALVLLSYSFVAYPMLGLLVTHPYPETPLFGVTPCPTTIFTLGMLAVASCPRPFLLASVPMLWVVIGGSAALLLDIPQDWGLFVAGLIWLAVWYHRRRSAPPQTTD